MKKGQLDQLLWYILALFVSGLILFYGYRAITGLQSKAEEIAFVRFEKSLRAKIETTASQYGSVRIAEFPVPLGVSKVCFADEKKNIALSGEDTEGLCDPADANYNAVVCNAIKDRTDNVFLLPTLQNLKINKIRLPKATLCISTKGGLLKLRLEGTGDATSIEKI